MISGNFKHCKTLEEFHAEIVKIQEEAHGNGYCDVHKAIQQYANGKRYIELGINQGATLAAANLCKDGLQSCYAYDIHINRVQPYLHLFNKVGWKFIVKEASSIDRKILKECDVLYVDTLHKWHHMAKELNLWAPYVKETIICHDTKAIKQLKNGLNSWIKENNEWNLIHIDINVGYSILERKK